MRDRCGKYGWIHGLATVSAIALVGCGTSSGSPNGNFTFDGGIGQDAGVVLTDGGTTMSAQAVTQTNLVSDGMVTTPNTDPNLVNAWGLAASSTGPFWVSDNGTGLATVYNGTGAVQSLVVTIPPAANAASGAKGTPTGVAFNGMTSDFHGDQFIFATEDGTIAGWQTGTTATTRVDRSSASAVYKGVAIAGGTLFATNFNSGAVDTFDSNYKLVSSIHDPNLQAGFAPFGIAFLNSNVYVSFAKQDAAKHDDVHGAGNGFIDVFDATGTMIRRLVSDGPLNSPWGMVISPANFGSVGNKLLVGNFGDGHINVFDPNTGAFEGELTMGAAPLAIDGLWGLSFGNGVMSGGTNELFFTAGPGMEMHGLFGKLTVNP